MQYFLAIVAALNEAERDELIVTSPHHKLSPLDKSPYQAQRRTRMPLQRRGRDIGGERM